MGVSRVHHCIGQEMVAKEMLPPPAKSCRCRKFISSTEAEALVKNGTARWTVIDRVQGLRDEPCRLCNGDKDVKNCAFCGGKGVVSVNAIENIKSYDIVTVSAESADEKEKKYRPTLAMKTPRVATIESEHIERAYVLGVKEAQMRIEEYGELEQQRLAELIVLVPAEQFDKDERDSYGRAPFQEIPSHQQTKGNYGRIRSGWSAIKSDGNKYGD